MSQQNKELIRRWFEEVWNRGSADALNEILASNAKIHNLPTDPSCGQNGPCEFQPLVEKFRSALPDLNITVDDMIAEGDKVVARCTVRGTHRGDALGFAPTEKAVEITGITIARIENNQIVEGWNNFDFMRMFQQLGVLPEIN